MVSDKAIESAVQSLMSFKDYICMGTLENELEQLFPSEERDGRCPDGLHEAMSIAESFLKRNLYQMTPKCDGYERLQGPIQQTPWPSP